MELHLMRPEWLWSLLPAVVLALLLWRQRQRRGSWSTVIAPQLLPHLVGSGSGAHKRNFLPVILLGWVFTAIAAAGPSWQKIPQPVHQKHDAMVLLLDLSYSMKSADLPPSRLDRARQKLLDLLQERREGQTGLIAYAGDAHIVTPLTDDTPTIANLLPALHPDMMPVPGSNAAAAVSNGLELLRSAGVRGGKMLLVTDGVSDKQRGKIVKALKGSAVQLTVMGVGTPAGAPIPLPRGGFLKDNDGTIVMPSLEEQALRKLAGDSGGHYTAMKIDDSDLRALLAQSPLNASQETLALNRTADAWDDQGYLFLLPLLPLVLGLFRRGWVLALLPLLFLSEPPQAQAQSWNDLWLTPDQQGQRALQQGDNNSAATLFKNPEWAGTAAYRDGDYDSAVEKFTQRADADNLYNKGNALARAGKLDEAMAAYQASLELQPDKQDAQQNLELLEKLKEQQEQQQNQEGQEGQDQDQQQEGQDQQQGQNQQGQNQQGQDSGQQQESQQPGEPGAREQQPGQYGDEEESEPQQTQANSDEQQSEERQAQQARAAQNDQGEGQESEGEPASAMAQASPEERERDQAMEQWLRRVPDDPSGLLREKFRYESQKRQEKGAGRDNETVW